MTETLLEKCFEDESYCEVFLLNLLELNYGAVE